jgi:peroxiredoxin
MSANSPTMRLVGTAVFLGVLAVAGGYLGVRVAQRQPAQPVTAAAVQPPERAVPTFLQASLAHLPRVQLVGTENAVPVASSDVLPEGGGIVLFLDMDCDPCKFVAGQWQDHIRNGRIGPERVVGITPYPADAIASFRKHLDLEFPIYSDPLQKYVSEHGVDTFPWEVVVDPDGTVTGYAGELEDMGKLESLDALQGS